jgi:hypothetical protein
MEGRVELPGRFLLFPALPWTPFCPPLVSQSSGSVNWKLSPSSATNGTAASRPSPTTLVLSCSVAFPFRPPPKGQFTYSRRNGKFFLEVTGHPQFCLPFGQDRLIPIWVATLAVQQKSRRRTGLPRRSPSAPSR